MDTLDNFISKHVFNYLSLPDLLVCQHVCSNFNKLTKATQLYNTFFGKKNTTIKEEWNGDYVGWVCQSAVVYDKKLYVFGGHRVPKTGTLGTHAAECIQRVGDNLQIYDFVTQQWSDPVSTSFHRSEHTAVVWGDSMYIFGGYSDDWYKNNVLTFNFTSQTWSEMQTVGHAPATRSAHSAVVVGDSMFLFGGWDGTQTMSDMHELHFPTKTWTKVEYEGVGPVSRCSHGAVVLYDSVDNNENIANMKVYEENAGEIKKIDKNAYMYVFGGTHLVLDEEGLFTKKYLQDLQVYHFATKTWKEIQLPNTPSSRSRFKMIPYNNNKSFYLFGGWNSSTYFKDLYMFSLDNQKWTHVPTQFMNGDGKAQFTLSIFDDVLYIYAGFTPTTRVTNSFYAYPLIPQFYGTDYVKTIPVLKLQ